MSTKSVRAQTDRRSSATSSLGSRGTMSTSGNHGATHTGTRKTAC